MLIELAEKLKAKLTDKWVVVDGSAPELRRFANWTGKVKTVNMNCRALVEFDGAVDIGWYDIDPAFLTVVDGPRPKKVETKAAAAPAPTAKPAAAPAAKPAGMSPLEAARAQGAAKAAAAPAAPAAPAAGKPSPLDLIRKQGAAKSGGAAAPAATAPAVPAAPIAEAALTPAADAPPPAAEPAVKTAPPPASAPEGRKLSPIEMIRMQGAAKRSS